MPHQTKHFTPSKPYSQVLVIQELRISLAREITEKKEIVFFNKTKHRARQKLVSNTLYIINRYRNELKRIKESK